tara:strand:- start:38289 stop:38642 length:354 start_codon:yes stop_codon:yes gene_type:complete
MIGDFGRTQIMVSEHAVRRWSERRLRFERYIFRGVTETRTHLVTVDCEEPAAWQLCGQIVMHPILYERLLASPQVANAAVKSSPLDEGRHNGFQLVDPKNKPNRRAMSAIFEVEIQS